MANLFGSWLHFIVGAASPALLLFYSCTAVEDYNGREVKAGYSMWGTPASTLLVRVEDVVFRLHGHMARVSAI